MKTFLKIFSIVAIATALYSCGLFDSKDPEKTPEEKNITAVPEDTSKIDTLNKAAEVPANDTGIVIKEEVKEEVKN